MDFNLNLTQEQKLVMTQQMQLSVRLLQMSSIELLEYIEEELQENPVLEANYGDGEEKKIQNRVDYKELIKYLEFDSYAHGTYEKEDEELSPFNFIADKKSLKSYLMEQISELSLEEPLRDACEFIIDNIDDRGYLDPAAAENDDISTGEFNEALSVVQSLEPDGVGARDLKECLKIQLKKKEINNQVIFMIIDDYMEQIADNKYGIISKELGITPKEAQSFGDIIRSLEPKPSRGFYTGEEVRYIVPDAYVKKINDEYFITLNDDLMPKLFINNSYREILKNNVDKKAVEYVKSKIDNAFFLIRSLDSRKTTIYRVIQKIVELQRDYFDHGPGCIRPMTLRQIAGELELHESTVSRAIRDKYIYTSHGTIRLKDLFTTGIESKDSGEDISTNKIKDKIKELIAAEDRSRPLSDQDICDALNKEQMNISRRTVAKYREEAGIKSSSKRKRF